MRYTKPAPPALPPEGQTQAGLSRYPKTMQDRIELLEKIAEKVAHLRILETMPMRALDKRWVMDSLKAARAEIDELLDDLARLER